MNADQLNILQVMNKRQDLWWLKYTQSNTRGPDFIAQVLNELPQFWKRPDRRDI